MDFTKFFHIVHLLGIKLLNVGSVRNEFSNPWPKTISSLGLRPWLEIVSDLGFENPFLTSPPISNHIFLLKKVLPGLNYLFAGSDNLFQIVF